MFFGQRALRKIRELSHIVRDCLREVRAQMRALLKVDAMKEAAQRAAPVILVNALRHARCGSRNRTLRQSLAIFSKPVPSPPADLCKLNTIKEFDTGYARLAALLGRSQKTPSPDEREFLQALTQRNVNHPGSIGASDYLFLSAFISILAPRRVVEIGTLTGFSAAIIAAAIRRQHGTDTPWVDTIDTRTDYAYDTSRPTGFEISELAPQLAPMIRLHNPHDSGFVGQICLPNELEVAFIDADHRHPFPLLDLLRLAPYVRRSGWLVLHDIELGTMISRSLNAGKSVSWDPLYGAEWIFEQWPFRKISCGNIGALQLPDDMSALVPFALRMMSVPFETEQRYASQIRRKLYQSIAALCR
jgi:predicted O-methyltransferase YrrM